MAVRHADLADAESDLRPGAGGGIGIVARGFGDASRTEIVSEAHGNGVQALGERVALAPASAPSLVPVRADNWSYSVAASC